MKNERKFLTPDSFKETDETKYVPSVGSWMLFVAICAALIMGTLTYISRVASIKPEPPESTTVFTKDDLEMELVGIYMLDENGERTENLLDVEWEVVDYASFQFVLGEQYAADFKIVNHTDKTDTLTLSVRSECNVDTPRFFSLDVFLEGANQDERIAQCMARDVWVVEPFPFVSQFQYASCYTLKTNGEEEKWRYWETSAESVVNHGLMTQYLLDDTEFVIPGRSEQVVSIRFSALDD